MRFLALLLLGLMPAASPAQKEKSIACRFIALKGAPPPELINIGQEEDVEVKVTMRSNVLSPDIFCSKQGSKLLFVTPEDRKPAAEANIPANVRNAILVFGKAPEGAGKLPWRVFVIEDSLKKFPDGGAYVTNFHSAHVRFIIGEEKAMLPPAGAHGFPQPAKRDEFNMAPVIFQFQNKQDEWTTASETVLRFVPGMRYLMFAYVDPVSLRPRVTTVKDFKQHKAAPARRTPSP